MCTCALSSVLPSSNRINHAFGPSGLTALARGFVQEGGFVHELLTAKQHDPDFI